MLFSGREKAGKKLTLRKGLWLPLWKAPPSSLLSGRP
jgi:hypothetical protein